eukprot:2608251-Rhodomonas_salina.1
MAHLHLPAERALFLSLTHSLARTLAHSRPFAPTTPQAPSFNHLFLLLFCLAPRTHYVAGLLHQVRTLRGMVCEVTCREGTG